MVDAADLKSADFKQSYGFKSRLKHKNPEALVSGFFA